MSATDRINNPLMQAFIERFPTDAKGRELNDKALKECERYAAVLGIETDDALARNAAAVLSLDAGVAYQYLKRATVKRSRGYRR